MKSIKVHQDFNRGLYKQQSWSEIYSSLMCEERQNSLQAEELYTLSLAAYLIGKGNESADILARAHHQFLKKEDLKQAVRSAFWIGMQLMFKGERARASGWFSRAHRLNENYRYNGPEKGLLLIPVALGFLGGGDAEKAYATFKQAAEAGEGFNDPDLNTLSILGQGQALIHIGNISEGLAMLDEAMVAVESDNISPLVVGIVYCAVIETCLMIFDLRRAQEWTTVLSRWCESQPDLVPFRGQCLVRRSQIMHLHGKWPEALDAMNRACHILSQPPGEPAAGEAYYQLAEIYRLKGDYEKAEKLYLEGNKWGRKPQPGLAQVRLHQDKKAASIAVQNALDEAKNPLTRIKILPAYIDIMLASDDKIKARMAAEELSAMVKQYDSVYIQAVATYSEGAVLLAEGNTAAASGILRQSWNLWNEIGTPYEVARVRVLLGTAYRKEGDEESATMEFSAAQWIFGELKAVHDFKMVQSLIKANADRDLQGLTLRELQVLRLISDGETNKSIAGKLFISERTVERHLSNIFNKLEVDSRTAATAYAFKNNLF